MNDLLPALAEFARGHGVRVEEPIVLSGTSNMVVHLAPAPVVARVPHVTASGRDRPEISLARELAITGRLDECGIRTTAPSRELPAGPHRIDGDRWASFVDYVQLTPVPDRDAALAGGSLVDVIDAMAGLDDSAGLFDRSLCQEADVSLALLEGRMDEEDRRLLLELRAETMIEPPEDAQVVHADPHRGNVGRRPDGELVWFDFDGPELARFVRQRIAWGDVWMQHFGLVLGGEHAARADRVLAGHRR